MITLVNPHSVMSVLGGTATVPYDKCVILPLSFDGIKQRITGTLRLSSTSNPTMQPIFGTLSIDVPTATLTVEVGQLDFYRKITLSNPQSTAILAQIEAAQAEVENGLVTLGLVSGVRTPGV